MICQQELASNDLEKLFLAGSLLFFMSFMVILVMDMCRNPFYLHMLTNFCWLFVLFIV